jgi:hypothetical protein
MAPGIAHLGIQPVALGHVAQQRHDLVAGFRRLAVDDGRQADFHPREFRNARRLSRIIAAHAHLDRARACAVVDLGKGRHIDRPIEHMDALDQAIAGELVAWRAEQLLRGLAGKDHRAVGPKPHHGILHALDEVPVGDHLATLIDAEGRVEAARRVGRHQRGNEEAHASDQRIFGPWCLRPGDQPQRAEAADQDHGDEQHPRALLGRCAGQQRCLHRRDQRHGEAEIDDLGVNQRQHEADQQGRVDLPERRALVLPAAMQRERHEPGTEPNRHDDERHQRAFSQQVQSRGSADDTGRDDDSGIGRQRLAPQRFRPAALGLQGGAAGLSAKQRVEEATHY